MKLQYRLFLLLFLFLRSNDGHTFYNGSCSSQGEWVTSALTQADSIIQAVENLKSDPNCTGIESAVKKLDIAKNSNNNGQSQFVQNYSQLNREIRDLRMMSAEGNAAFQQRVTDILMNRVVNEADLASKSTTPYSKEALDIQHTAQSLSSLDQRVANALDTMFSGANEVLNVLPQLRSCFNNRPNEALAIFAGMVRMGGAVIDGGEGVTSRAGSFIANLVTFVRNNEYAKVLSQINEKEYWSSMSCLIETSAQAYCTAKDAYVILEDQKKLRLEERASDMQAEESPLRGYYLLVREIPRVSEWLQRVIIGLPPQMDAQAEFQKNVNNSYLELLNTRLSLEGRYSQKLNTYQSTYGSLNTDQVLQAKRAFVVDLLSELIGIMYNSGGRDSVNFFAMTLPETTAPFVLLGVDYPQELTKTETQMSWQKYLSVHLNSFSALSNPDETILRIKTNLDELLQSVMSTGAVYYATWYIPDATRVVDEAVSIEPPNILQSFKNINDYIDQSIVRYVRDRQKKISDLKKDIVSLSARYKDGDSSVLVTFQRKKNLLEFYESATILPSLYDTRIRITKVIKIFEQRQKNFDRQVADLENFVTLDKEMKDEYFLNLIEQEQNPNSGENIANLVMDTIGKQKSKDLKTMDQEILREAFDQFNVLLQRDTFLFNRFYNYILSEYMERVQNDDEQNIYLRDLLAVTGRNLINRFVSINRLNPNSTGLDLAQAHPINLENLESLEQLLAKDIKVAICKITMRIGGTQKQMRGCSCLVHSNGKSDYKFTQYCTEDWKLFDSGSHPKRVSKGDDEFHSFSQLKAKYCIQALSFPTKWSEFQEICEDSVLLSQFSEEAKLDNVAVDASFSEYSQNFSAQEQTSERICALRDFIRRNQVYWLLNKNVY